MSKRRGGRKRGPARVVRRPVRPVMPAAPVVEESDGWVPPTRLVMMGPVHAAGRVRRQLEDQVVLLVNQARRRAGIAELRPDERLRASARGHCERMATLDFFAHEDPDGSGPAQRMRAAGYSAPGAENIASGQREAVSVMRAWMNSPGHRANIVNPRFVTIGVGVDVRAGGPWWTQHFGY